MKVSDIQVGKKYYHELALNYKDNFTGVKKRQVLIMRVVEVDINKNRVCASMNGFPAVWYEKTKVSKWKDKNPETV